jgi:DNA-binding SARP family transcriptional activator
VAGLSLLLLGPPRIELEGEAVALKRRKVLALLAYLAVTARPHDRDHLAELLYPEVDRDRAAAGLRQSLSYLRESLGARWVESGPREVSLPHGKGLYLDVAEFRHLLKRAGPAAGGMEDESRLEQLARCHVSR